MIGQHNPQQTRDVRGPGCFTLTRTVCGGGASKRRKAAEMGLSAAGHVSRTPVQRHARRSDLRPFTGTRDGNRPRRGERHAARRCPHDDLPGLPPWRHRSGRFCGDGSAVTFVPSLPAQTGHTDRHDWRQHLSSLASAIDRLVHHSIILELNLPSYRMEQAKRTTQDTMPSAAKGGERLTSKATNSI